MDEMQGHIKELDKKITALSDALAKLGRGTSLPELIKIIHFPGYTTPAEFALTVTILDAMQVHAGHLEKMGMDLLEASKKVSNRHMK